MSRSEDINTLFRRFGGDVSDYQEIVESDKELDIKKTWPLLAQVDLGDVPAVPAVQFLGAEVDPVLPDVDTDSVDKIGPVSHEDPTAPPSNKVPATAFHETASLGGGNIFAKFSKSPSVDGRNAVAPVATDTKLKTIFSRLARHSLPVAPTPQPLKKQIKW